MLSSRYTVPVIGLLILALIPTTIHSYIVAKVDDGLTVHNIATSLHNFDSAPAKRNKKWGMDIFGSEDWFERDYQDAQYNRVRLFTARAFDHKRLYHHPELALSYGNDLGKADIMYSQAYPEIPFFVLRKEDNSMLVAYVLLYDNKFVASPITHQLGESMRLLVSPRKPMTLFYASQSGLHHAQTFDQTAAASVLSLAVQSFQSQANH